MRLIISKKAEKQIQKLPQLVKFAVGKKIRELVYDEGNLQIKKLQGYEKIYRIRTGNFRIVYYRDSNITEVLVVQHRKDVYRGEYQ